MRENIIGREYEIELMEQYVASPKSEFIAVYGRRRIGKTYLIRELFENRFTFRCTGKDNISTSEQLRGFCYAMTDQLGIDASADNWTDALRLLQKAIEAMPIKAVKILFFDELPWFETRNSHFVSALEHFWNDWAAYRTDIKLIACGSATTWMLSNVINARGGLHNRVTHTILLAPFNLAETEEYFSRNGFGYQRQEILDSYMAVGGVAYYLTLFSPKESVAQNIQRLCFSRGGELVQEFAKVFRALYKKADKHEMLIEALSRKGCGMTRAELLSTTGINNNGNISVILKELELCDFIRSYSPFGKKRKERLYQLIDPFTLFYFRFMRGNSTFGKNHWLKQQNTPGYHQWCGYAFELVCLNHISQIVKALGIDGCINEPCSWTYRAPKAQEDEFLKGGAQIDLLIDRSDRTITICEMKYSTGEYAITKEEDAALQRRMEVFRRVTDTRKSLMATYITPNGLFNNMYARRLTRVVVGDDLFVGK